MPLSGRVTLVSDLLSSDNVSNYFKFTLFDGLKYINCIKWDKKCFEVVKVDFFINVAGYTAKINK